MNRVLDDITRFIFVRDEPAPADIIFIPGGSHPQPAERAAALFGQGLAKLVLPSGRFYIENGAFPGVKEKADIYDGTYGTEWEFMRGVLMKNGVPGECVLKEDESTYTMENAVFSRLVCDASNIKVSKAILCCKSFHARRALIYYQSAFPETDFIVAPADVSGISADNWHKHSANFDRVMGELAKCGGQAADTVRALTEGGDKGKME